MLEYIGNYVLTWLSKGRIMLSSVLKALPNMWYWSRIGGGGLGALLLRTISSVYWFMYCTGGKGKELTWIGSEFAMTFYGYLLRRLTPINDKNCSIHFTNGCLLSQVCYCVMHLTTWHKYAEHRLETQYMSVHVTLKDEKFFTCKVKTDINWKQINKYCLYRNNLLPNYNKYL